ncbi:Ig-like domain-containing protein [Clostridium cochlearium]|uniref:Ig-like domain-containing protein n=1 Tax=Clostridium cochlearium TaxID=1494 RepID=UPI00241E72B1|nr:Ig-like domain-containing protein [Clostridium cochlearium]
MKNNKKFNVLLSSAAIVTMLSTMGIPNVLAADRDIRDLKTGEIVVAENEYKNDLSKRNQVLLNWEDYGFELGNKVYTLSDTNEVWKTDKTMESIPEALKDKVQIDLNEELKVESVSAITTTVDVTAGSQLEFAINGKTEAADLEELVKEGYTVEFLASKAVFTDAKSTSDNGKLIGLAEDTTFKYQVKVSKDGKVVAESELKEVTVQDKKATVTEISAIELYITQATDVDVKVRSGKLAENDTAKVVVMGRTANMKADEKDADITSKVALSTDKVAIATVASDGKLDLLNKAKGDVTITAKAGDITKAITVNAGNAERAISKENSTITPATLSLATGDKAKIEVVAKDQYGDVFVLAENKLTTDAAKNAEDKEIAAAVSTGSAKGDKDGKTSVEVSASSTEAGTGDIVVKGNGAELGKVALTVKKAGEIATYKLETADKKYELELMGATEDAPATLTLALNGYDKEGLFVDPTIALKDYTFESSNEKVATVDNETNKGKVTAVAPGTAVIKVYKTEDAFKTTVAEVTVTVKNSTPTITDAKVVAPEKMTAIGDIDLAKIFTEVTALDPEGKAVEVNDFSGTKVTVGKTPVEIGSFLVTKVGADTITVTNTISSGKIALTGSGKATINIALLNAKGEIVKDVNVEVDILAGE